jgi:hypothetical protein
MIHIKINKKTNRDQIASLGRDLLGEDRVRDITFHIGNYWDMRRSGLDTETLFREMLRIFKKKKLVKEMMNCSRDEAIQRMVERDVENVLHTWQRKCVRLLVRDANFDLVTQVLSCDTASLKIEEDSECKVVFRDDVFESTVEGRRSIVGKLRSEFVRKYVNDMNEAITENVTRKLIVFNNFTRKTFWRTTGKVHTIVELEEKDGVKVTKAKKQRRGKQQKDLFGN